MEKLAQMCRHKDLPKTWYGNWYNCTMNQNTTVQCWSPSTAPELQYHPYVDGYWVKPKLTKLGSSKPFVRDAECDEYLAFKAAPPRDPSHGSISTTAARHAIVGYINKHASTEYPDYTHAVTLGQAARQIQEDLVVVEYSGEADRVSAVHADFPGGWRPNEMVGLNMDVIHRSVPGLEHPNRLARMMLAGSFVRHVWGLRYARELDTHPDSPRAKYAPGGPLWVRVERQVIIGLPHVHAVLFIVRSYYVVPDRQVLLRAIKGMSHAQREYKDIPNDLVREALFL